MSDESPTKQPENQDGVIAADQSPPEPLTLLTGPTTGNDFNTISDRLIPKGCFRVEDVRFEFDSSFVLPEVAGEMPLLADLIEKHSEDSPGPPPSTLQPPLSVFGHADPVGNDDYNKQLSGRRATAVYAMLVRDVDLWENLFSKPLGGDNWGNPSIQRMLAALGHSPGPIDGIMGERSKAAVQAFQTENGLAVDGVAGPQTRKALFQAYMEFLCGPRLLLDKEKNFLARGKDKDGKGDFQGCGEFNPVLMFSKAENQEFEQSKDKSARNLANAPNRRVMILLFAPGRRVNPKFWPCPRAKEGVADCKKRFFSDADKRRAFQEERREFSQSKDTFACRFYQVVSSDSPCERILEQFRIRLFDTAAQALPGAPFLAVTETRKVRGTTNGEGDAIVPDLKVPATCEVFWSRPSDKKPAPEEPEDFEFSLAVNVLLGDADSGEGDDETAAKRLQNLGYTRHPSMEENVKDFQIDIGKRGEEITGELSDVREELKKRHDSLEPPPRTPRSGAG